MNIEGIGEETAMLFYKEGLVNNIADLYDLRPEQIAVLPRLGEKSASNIIKSIAGSADVPFERVLYALGIRFVGETTARNIAVHFGSLDAVMTASAEQLEEAEEVGGRIASSVKEYFSDEHNLDIVNRLKNAGLQFETSGANLISDSLSGLSIVISGTFERHSRDELKNLIEKHGGKNLSAVSSNADFLLAGNNMGPAKLSKANKLGVRIISESDFEEMLQGADPERMPEGATRDGSGSVDTGELPDDGNGKGEKEMLAGPAQGTLF